MFVFFALSGVCTVCETTVDLQARALMFIQCGVLWFCYVFTLFYVSRRRDLAQHSFAGGYKLSPWHSATVQKRQ